MSDRPRVSAGQRPEVPPDQRRTGGPPPEPHDVDVPPLVRFVLRPDGATMSCHYCGFSSPVVSGDVACQIMHFQEAHFGCDPALSDTTAAAEAHVPPQGTLD